MEKPVRTPRSNPNRDKVVVGALEEVPFPDGVEFKTEEELKLWSQFTQIRLKQDWRQMDLVMVAKMVTLEIELRKHQKTLDEEGATWTSATGNLRIHPLVQVIDSLQRRQIALIKCLALTVGSGDANVGRAEGANKRGRPVGSTKQQLAEHKRAGNVIGLLAGVK